MVTFARIFFKEFFNLCDTLPLIGASLSEPHTSESNSAIVSMYIIIIIMVRTSAESKYKILILRIVHYVCEAHYA